MARRLEKSKNRMVLGVAGGVAEYFKIDPVIVRIIFILLVFANGVGALLYLVLALIMPKAEAAGAPPLAVVKENLMTAPQEAKEASRRVVEVLRGSPVAPKEPSEKVSTPKDGETPSR